MERAMMEAIMKDGPQAQARRWYAQRISAMVLAILVVVHLAIMVYAVRGGLSGAEILARTQGNVFLAAYYALFVLSCAVHVPTGLANIAMEWMRWPATRALLMSRGIALLLLATGLRAVYAVFTGGAS
jgi:fumarate reductase subunit C